MDIAGRHPIRVVARKTGLTSHVIRIWEKRYGAVAPMRTDTKRRLYSDADVQRLCLLRQATLSGRSIGQIADLPTETLQALVAADAPPPMPPSQAAVSTGNTSPASLLEACLDAAQRLDTEALEATLTQAAVVLSQPLLMEQVIVPLLHRIGGLWQVGALRVAHEHLASTTIRSFLWNLSRRFTASLTAPLMIITTPTGQMHEFGALIVATIAAWDGWHSTYLGPSLPAEEIAAAAHQHRVRVVALSIVYPADDPRLWDELIMLRRGMGDNMVLLVGGRAAGGYADVLERIGAVRMESITALRSELERLRRPHTGNMAPPG
jgi:MerR family transcriptional regulator, light-induced transcriptional regulator